MYPPIAPATGATSSDAVDRERRQRTPPTRHAADDARGTCAASCSGYACTSCRCSPSKNGELASSAPEAPSASLLMRDRAAGAADVAVAAGLSVLRRCWSLRFSPFDAAPPTTCADAEDEQRRPRRRSRMGSSMPSIVVIRRQCSLRSTADSSISPSQEQVGRQPDAAVLDALGAARADAVAHEVPGRVAVGVHAASART